MCLFPVEQEFGTESVMVLRTIMKKNAAEWKAFMSSHPDPDAVLPKELPKGTYCPTDYENVFFLADPRGRIETGKEILCAVRAFNVPRFPFLRVFKLTFFFLSPFNLRIFFSIGYFPN